MAKDRAYDVRRQPNLEHDIQEDPNEWAQRKFGAEMMDYAENRAEREAEHEADKAGK